MFRLSNSEIDSVRSQIVTSRENIFLKSQIAALNENGNKRGLHIK